MRSRDFFAADPPAHRGALLLGIESSCDETACALLDGAGRVRAAVVLSQFTEHAPHGGVVPEIAARAHLAHLPRLVGAALAEAGAGFGDIGAVAATAGPGLIGGLIVGSSYAKGVALARGVPFLAVNHLEAHALTVRLPGLRAEGAAFPYLLLLVSGGHTLLAAVEGVGRYVRLGSTLDDAAGEAFDKAAKLLGLGWPGGPALERLAAAGDARRHRLPRPLLGRKGCDFSFSGLKTALALAVGRCGEGGPTAAESADLAAGFQAAVAAVMADRAAHAMALFAERHPGMDAPGARLLVAAGGVAANATVRDALAQTAARRGFALFAPPPALCTDNAVMVAWAGIERLREGRFDPLDFAPRPRWPLETLETAG